MFHKYTKKVHIVKPHKKYTFVYKANSNTLAAKQRITAWFNELKSGVIMLTLDFSDRVELNSVGNGGLYTDTTSIYFDFDDESIGVFETNIPDHVTLVDVSKRLAHVFFINKKAYGKLHE